MYVYPLSRSLSCHPFPSYDASPIYKLISGVILDSGFGKNSLWMAFTASVPCESSHNIEMFVLLAP